MVQGSPEDSGEPQSARTLEVPLVDEITPDHTIRQFLLSALFSIIAGENAKLVGSYEINGNVFKWRFEILQVAMPIDAPDKNNPQ